MSSALDIGRDAVPSPHSLAASAPTAAVRSSSPLLSSPVEPENAPGVVLEARRIVLAEDDAKAQAAQRIQSCWREYRDAVTQLEQLTSGDEGGTDMLRMLMFDGVVVDPSVPDEDAVLSGSQGEGAYGGGGGGRWGGSAHPTSPPASLRRRSRASSQTSQYDDGVGVGGRSASLGSSGSDLQSILHSILTTAGDLDDEHTSRDEIIREYAATIIQRNVRRSLLSATNSALQPLDGGGEGGGRAAASTLESVRVGGDEAADFGDPLGVPRESSSTSVGGSMDLSDTALQALRILQNRFRFQRFRRMIEEREHNEVIRRIQQLWRRRKDLKRHFEALRNGREDVAARDIQRAYLRHREHRQLLLQQQQRGRNAPAAETAAEGSLQVPSKDRIDGEGSNDEEATPSAPTAARRSRSHSERGGGSAVAAQQALPQCIICMYHFVQIAFLPCGHAHTCVECAAQCLRCPSCRRMVALQIRIYL